MATGAARGATCPMMRVEMATRDHYRTLELEPGASEEEVRRAWRDLTKVWHPDRFGNDEQLRRRAEEKLKAINEAYDEIRRSGSRGSRSTYSRPEPDSTPGWRVRDGRQERAAADLRTILAWIVRGNVTADDEIWDPRQGRWMPVMEVPEARELVNRIVARRYRSWAAFLILAALFMLFRRPSEGSAITAAIFISVAVVLWILAASKR